MAAAGIGQHGETGGVEQTFCVCDAGDLHTNSSAGPNQCTDGSGGSLWRFSNRR
jgi:hypothetical protein